MSDRLSSHAPPASKPAPPPWRLLPSSGLSWDLRQPWQDYLDPDFSPGRVFCARQADDLLVLADLEDKCVSATNFPFNFPAFTESDVFEIFYRPAGSTTYHELHVSPTNSILQLELEVGSRPRALENHTVARPLLTSFTELTSKGWKVRARILSVFVRPVEYYHFSFCRYDYTIGQEKPVRSSTSPHTACNFHRLFEWRSVQLTELPTVSDSLFVQPLLS